MSTIPLEQFDPSWEPLFADIVDHLDDSNLCEIASADFGEDYDDHLAALREIFAGKVPDDPISWVPGEVLGLTRNTHPDDDEGHWMRLFSCCVLLRTTGGIAEELTVLRLTNSAIALGSQTTVNARRFLCWVLTRDPHCSCPYVAIAILILSNQADDLSATTADCIIALVREHFNHDWDIWRFFDRTTITNRDEWIAIVREHVRDSPRLNGKLQEFGKYILLEKDGP